MIELRLTAFSVHIGLPYDRRGDYDRNQRSGALLRLL